MLSGLFVFLSGAKRWFNAEAVKALAAVLVALVLVTGAALLFSAGGAKRDAQWLSRFNAWNVLQAKIQARRAAAVAEAEAKSRTEAEQRAEEAVQRAAVLAAELERMKGKGQDAQVFTAEERGRLFRQ